MSGSGRARLPDLAVREVVPRTRHPNFRDHHMTVDRPLMDLVWSLTKRYGEAFASESGLRRMLCEDTGHMPGVDTVPCALERLEGMGLLAQDWLLKGGIMPDGEPCHAGTRLLIPARDRHERRAFILRAKRRNRRVGVKRLPDAVALATLGKARAQIALAVAPLPDTAAHFDAQRRAQLEALRALAATGAFDAPREKPPP